MPRLKSADRAQTRVDRSLGALGSSAAAAAESLSGFLAQLQNLSEEQQMPYEQIRKAYKLPFELRPYQWERMNEHGHQDRAGFYWEPGSGKTAGATCWMLYRSMTGAATQWLLLMPPILLRQWARWLESIHDADTKQALSVTIYRGTPKKRRELSLDTDFILMSPGIFKNDYDYLAQTFNFRDFGGLVDEATSIKNIESGTHKAIKNFFEGRPLALLTGTPLTTPADAYAYIRLLAPSLYRNHRHFTKLHYEEIDQYENVVEWKNLDVLEQNMKVNSTRVLRREVRKDLPDVIYTPFYYDLEPDHANLYRRIAEERLVEFSDSDREIDAISAQALRSALQQVVINYGEFAGDPSLRPAALDLVEATLEELGPGKKLMVVAHFIRTNRYLLSALQHYGTVALYGEVSPAKKDAAIKRFLEDPTCRVVLVQPQAAGFGVDGLQHVCSDMLVLEAPTLAKDFNQVVARLDRDGQVNPVNCRIGIAAGTVQVRMFRNLLNNDALVNSVQGGYMDLKEAIFGH